MQPDTVIKQFVDAVIARELTSYRDQPDFASVADMVRTLAPTSEAAARFVAGATNYLKPAKIKMRQAMKGEDDIRGYVADMLEAEATKISATIAKACGLVQGILNATLSIPDLYWEVIDRGLFA